MRPCCSSICLEKKYTAYIFNCLSFENFWRDISNLQVRASKYAIKKSFFYNTRKPLNVVFRLSAAMLEIILEWREKRAELKSFNSQFHTSRFRGHLGLALNPIFNFLINSIMDIRQPVMRCWTSIGIHQWNHRKVISMLETPFF